jgi:PH (Pleckstrin Homology) domain-containing protein
VSFSPAPGEKIVVSEDCAEDKLRSGLLVLTDKRLVFQKTEGRMATLSKKEGDVVLDFPLEKITEVKSEGFLVKKVVIVADGQTYKFGVFSTGKWERQIKALKGAS